MTDPRTARMRSHQENIERYCRLLATQLTPYEREWYGSFLMCAQNKLQCLLSFTLCLQTGRVTHFG
jgi:hypothetical protein